MIRLIVSLKNIHELDPEYVGGKAYTLGTLLSQGLQIPSGLCITTRAYSSYVRSTGLMERISMELYRKDFSDMRWEEMWDASLRIRNMFLNTPMPSFLVNELRDPLEAAFGLRSVAVRSSAPGEDSSRVTFAGLHETYMNVCGVYSILEHIRLVWASLWADGALLYRQEMGLDVTTSSMAVLVQELVAGDKSGVVFGKNPNDEAQAVIESVYGLNQGLVDGTVEPDRWILDRKDGTILSHTPVKREQVVAPTSIGVNLEELAPEKREVSPLNDEEVHRVYELAMKAEEIFGDPQDVEWTYRGEELLLLQSRPITAISGENESDERSWYLTLRRSFGNLKKLRVTIEEELIPEMIDIAQTLDRMDLTILSDDDLGEEILKREHICDSWEERYWRYFIPFAHGMRLFGQIYNDKVRPVDPYEFMDMLATKDLISLKRNSMLEEMAKCVRKDMMLSDALKRHEDTSRFTEFTKLLDEFIDAFGDLACGAAECSYDSSSIKSVVKELSMRAPGKISDRFRDAETLADEFLSLFTGEMRGFVAEVLDIARASYRLRDDDNIYLGRIKHQMYSALNEGRLRLEKREMQMSPDIPPQEFVLALKDSSYVPAVPVEHIDSDNGMKITIRARQLIGQPASRGIVSGIARVLDKTDDLLQFRAGEILVCDALDPSMTFIVPLALGIVERRGGMLIHGAIIAREYGLPCVTGVPDATELIQTGRQITVDGYLGIVVLS